MRFQRDCLQKSPQWLAVLQIKRRLQEKGFQAVLAGGCVRDAFLGRIPQDLDLVTDASLDEMKKIFPKVILVGESFGVLRVLQGPHQIEVAQFREEGVYEDGRHPTSVKAATPQKDALRRDFTMNALFYDLLTEKVWDFVDGEKDLEQGLIRCVGEPEQRFAEDHLRILRALRFQAQLGFSIETETQIALERLMPLVARVSRERIQQELVKILLSQNSWEGLLSLERTKALNILFPERAENFSSHRNEIQLLFSKTVEDEDLALSFFLWGMKNPESIFSRLRWPKKREKEILFVLHEFLNFPSFLAKSKAEKLQIFSRPLFRKVGERVSEAQFFLKNSEGIQKSQILFDDLKEAWTGIQVNDQLPQPLVRAEHLPKEKPGPSLGEKLRWAYNCQLENPQWDREKIIAEMKKVKS